MNACPTGNTKSPGKNKQFRISGICNNAIEAKTV
jgi:hypothetical protein